MQQQILLDRHTGDCYAARLPSLSFMDLFQTLWQRCTALHRDSIEHVVALYIDKDHHELALCLLGSGTRDSCPLHPRTVFRIAVQLNAFGVVLGHTHPSGTLAASVEDQLATAALVEAGKLLRIPLLGHVVMTQEGWRLIDSVPSGP